MALSDVSGRNISGFKTLVCTFHEIAKDLLKEVETGTHVLPMNVEDLFCAILHVCLFCAVRNLINENSEI